MTGSSPKIEVLDGPQRRRNHRQNRLRVEINYGVLLRKVGQSVADAICRIAQMVEDENDTSRMEV